MIAKFNGRWQKNEQEMPLLTEKLSNHQNIWSLSIVSKFPPLLAIAPNKKTQKENAMGMVLLLLFLYFLYKKNKGECSYYIESWIYDYIPYTPNQILIGKI